MLLKVVMNRLSNYVELHFNFQYLLLTWILIFQALPRGGCGSNTRRSKYFFDWKSTWFEFFFPIIIYPQSWFISEIFIQRISAR